MSFATQAQAASVYHGNSGEVTVAYYKLLERYGAAGFVAMNLMRACKASERAKKYRGGNSKGSYRDMAYQKKQWSLNLLVQSLQANDVRLGITWGWGVDLKAVGFENVLYVDIPTGQVSFHSPTRGAGPQYEKPWDNKQRSADRIIAWCGQITSQPAKEQDDERSATGTR